MFNQPYDSHLAFEHQSKTRKTPLLWMRMGNTSKHGVNKFDNW